MIPCFHTIYSTIYTTLYVIRHCCRDHRWHHCYSMPSHRYHSFWVTGHNSEAPDLFQHLDVTGSRLSVYATRLRKQRHSERAGFCLEAQRNVFCLPASSHIKQSLFCSRGRLQKWRGGKDGWIPLNYHLYQPSSLLWGGCLTALRK